MREAEAREREKRWAPDKDEARGVLHTFDPQKNYYAILGIDRLASSQEIRKAYKHLALTMHPDKLRNADNETRDAVAEQFRALAEAYDVLSDERRRASYDRVRAQLQKGGPSVAANGQPLTQEEAAAMMAGMRELAKLRREGMRRTVKHPPLAAEIRVSLEKLHRGCTKRCVVIRTSVDGSGTVFEEQKTFHVIVRRGTPSGHKFLYEDAGSETGDLLPGDVVVTLLEKPHKLYRREGANDLVRMAAPLDARDIMYCEALTTLAGSAVVVAGSALLPSLAAGGQGGFIDHVLPGEGMPDPRDPWDHPPGDLHIRIRFSARETLRISTPLRPGPVFLLGSALSVLPAAVIGGAMAKVLTTRALAAEMEAEHCGWRDPAHRALPHAVCLVFDGGSTPSVACQAIISAAVAHAPGQSWKVIAAAADGSICDDEWVMLSEAKCIVVDFSAPRLADEDALAVESRIRDVSMRCASIGLTSALWLRSLCGACIAGVGDGVALLGAAPEHNESHQAVVLPLIIRAGGGAAGWSGLKAATGSWPAAEPGIGVGVLADSAVCVHPSIWWSADGAADIIVAPPREVLAATAMAAHQCIDDDAPDLGFAVQTRVTL